MGQFAVLQRVRDYWAQDLPARRGLFNFDYIRYDYFRDANIAFEAFKAGGYDFRAENSAMNWATQYTGRIFESGEFIREEILHNNPPPFIQALTFNVQREPFNDIRVRRAINYFFDFEWINKNIFYDQYERIKSFFHNTVYAARELPSPEELAILEPIRDQIPPEVFARIFEPPVSDGTGFIRSGMRSALERFNEAGWELRNGRLVNKETGRQMSFELMINTAGAERYTIPFQRNLARFGIDMRIRLVDSTQFLNRLWVND
jgi:microcin C transport system substrate-binding protein